jgi:hypothetical protein
MEFCNHKMTNHRLCGRPLFHQGRHLSEQSLAHRIEHEKENRRQVRVASKTRHRGIAMEVPPHLLPGSALASLAKYRASGMVRPGDTLYEKIATRLLQREGITA